MQSIHVLTRLLTVTVTTMLFDIKPTKGVVLAKYNTNNVQGYHLSCKELLSPMY